MMPCGWHEGAWGMLWMILSWGLIIAIAVLVVRALSPGPTDRPSEKQDPRTILDERFARGEISEDEYGERTRALEEAKR